jgi:branched-chain amino acid aminotransferase
MTASVNVNGRVFYQDHAVISVFDHGFLYGEGIYETLRTYNGEPFLFDRHMRRLRASASMLSLAVPLDNEAIAARFRDTLTAARLGDVGREAYIRILVTRVVVIVKELVELSADAYERGVKVAIVSIVRNHPGTVNPLIKSNNLLNSAMAMQEALRKGAFEGVMRNYRGELAECTTANLFVVTNGAAVTPPLDAGLLAGITREFLFEVGQRIGIPVREQVLHDQDLIEADEAFFTSTTRELVPITRVDDRVVAGGSPGPVTKALLAEFRKLAWSGLASAVSAGKR